MRRDGASDASRAIWESTVTRSRGTCEGGSKCTTQSTAGPIAVAAPKCTSISTAGSGGGAGQLREVEVVDAKRGRQSLCEPFRAVVESQVHAGLSAQCVYQDLVTEYGFKDSYESVKRYVHRVSSGRGGAGGFRSRGAHCG
jgi:hypothetical protein